MQGTMQAWVKTLGAKSFWREAFDGSRWTLFTFKIIMHKCTVVM